MLRNSVRRIREEIEEGRLTTDEAVERISHSIHNSRPGSINESFPVHVQEESEHILPEAVLESNDLS